jgi:glycosyltransferase involved in cell wall biosynthesis
MCGMIPHIGLNAHLLSGQAGYRKAGIHGYIYHLLAHLPAADSTWRYTAFVGEGVPPPGLCVRRARLPTGNPLCRILWEQAVQPWQLGGIDLVHETAFVAPLIMPRPFVVTVHDLSFIRYPERLTHTRRLYLRLMTRLSCHRAQRVIAVSQSTADDLAQFLGIPLEKIDVIISGVDHRQFCPLPPKEVAAWRGRMGLPERFLLFVGTLEPRKNLPVLLRAYAALPKADRERVHLILAGGRGWMTDEIDRAIETCDLASSVHLPGFIPGEALAWWYNAAEAIVYPSIFEGWGMPVSEAMACGKPALVSAVSSLPEAVGDTGLRLPPDDIAAWTAGLARCIEDGAWRLAEGERAMRYAARFTWQRTAAQTVKSYRRALGLIPDEA